MPKYGVCLPISGYVYVEVEAESEDAAIEAALDEQITPDMIEEWDTHRALVRGNVFHGVMREASAEEV